MKNISVKLGHFSDKNVHGHIGKRNRPFLEEFSRKDRQKQDDRELAIALKKLVSLQIGFFSIGELGQCPLLRAVF